jgi:hypothetical protein
MRNVLLVVGVVLLVLIIGGGLGAVGPEWFVVWALAIVAGVITARRLSARAARAR